MMLLLFFAGYAPAQTDFVQGANIIFEDDFNRDPVGDFPARWNTSGEGTVVTIDDVAGKWLKILQPTAVSPKLKKALPENCTIEFDLYLKSATGVAPHIMFGLTSLSNVATGDVFRRRISVKLEDYTGSGSVIYEKNIQTLGEKKFALEGFIERVLHVSISVNKTRFRVYLDDQKVIDLPSLLTPEYRNNFFVAGSTVIPSPEEGVYISNIRIGAGEADARSLLIKQLMEEGSVVTNSIQFSATNEITAESRPVVDQLGQVLQQNPDMSIQINSVEEVPATQLVDTTGTNGTTITDGNNVIVNKKALKAKADKIKAYLVNKFKVKVDRIITDVKVKATEAVAKNKTLGKAKQLLTEIIKL